MRKYTCSCSPVQLKLQRRQQDGKVDSIASYVRSVATFHLSLMTGLCPPVSCLLPIRDSVAQLGHAGHEHSYMRCYRPVFLYTSLSVKECAVFPSFSGRCMLSFFSSLSMKVECSICDVDEVSGDISVRVKIDLGKTLFPTSGRCLDTDGEESILVDGFRSTDTRVRRTHYFGCRTRRCEPLPQAKAIVASLSSM